MRKNAKSITASLDIIRHIDGLTEANFNLITRLVTWLDANEKAQRKFRAAVIACLTKVDAGVGLLLVSQMAEQQYKKPFYQQDKLETDAQESAEFISKQALEHGTAILKKIYTETKATTEGGRQGPRQDRRRKWQGWEI